MARPPDDPSGIMVYPKINVPKNDPSHPSHPRVKGFGGGGSRFQFIKDNKKAVIGIAIAAVVGGMIGFLVAPTHSGEADKAKTEAVEAKKVSGGAKERAGGPAKARTP